MEACLDETALLFNELLNLANKDFYSRRKSAIVEYNTILMELYYKCKGWFKRFNRNCSAIDNLDSVYDIKWASKDFYADYKRWFAGYIYDHTPSLTYHSYKKISSEALKICIEQIPHIRKIILEKFSNDESMFHVLRNYQKEFQNIRDRLQKMHENCETIRVL